MSSRRILIVEDEQHLADVLKFNLDAEGFAAVVQEAGRRGIPVRIVWPDGARRAG